MQATLGITGRLSLGSFRVFRQGGPRKRHQSANAGGKLTFEALKSKARDLQNSDSQEDDSRETLEILSKVSSKNSELRSAGMEALRVAPEGTQQFFEQFHAALCETSLPERPFSWLTGAAGTVNALLDQSLRSDDDAEVAAICLLLSKLDIQYHYVPTKLSSLLIRDGETKRRFALYALLTLAERGLKETKLVAMALLNVVAGRHCRFDNSGRMEIRSPDRVLHYAEAILRILARKDAFCETLVLRCIAQSMRGASPSHACFVGRLLRKLGPRLEAAFGILRSMLGEKNSPSTVEICRVFSSSERTDDVTCDLLIELLRKPILERPLGFAQEAARALASAKVFRPENLRCLFWLLSIQGDRASHLSRTVGRTPLAAAASSFDPDDSVIRSTPPAWALPSSEIAFLLLRIGRLHQDAFAAVIDQTVECLQCIMQFPTSVRLGLGLTACLLMDVAKQNSSSEMHQKKIAELAAEYDLFLLLEQDTEVIDDINKARQDWQ